MIRHRTRVDWELMVVLGTRTFVDTYSTTRIISNPPKMRYFPPPNQVIPIHLQIYHAGTLIRGAGLLSYSMAALVIAGLVQSNLSLTYFRSSQAAPSSFSFAFGGRCPDRNGREASYCAPAIGGSGELKFEHAHKIMAAS